VEEWAYHIEARSKRERTLFRPRSIPGVLPKELNQRRTGLHRWTFSGSGGTMELLHICDGRAVQRE
jgi:hypothetical protein